MSFVFKLNRYILVPFLTEWIDINDYVFLDTAVTNKENKTILLTLCWEFPNQFQNSYFTYDCVRISCELLSWLATRRFFGRVCCEVDERYLEHFRTLHPFVKYFNKLFRPQREQKRKKAISCKQSIRGIQIHLSVFYNEPGLFSRFAAKYKDIQELRIYYWEDLRSRNTSVKLSIGMIDSLALHWSFNHIVCHWSNLRRIQISWDITTIGLIPALIVWCRKLDSIEVFTKLTKDARKEQYMLAFHGTKFLTQLSIHNASPLLTKTLLWYRGGTTLKTLTIIDSEFNCEDVKAAAPEVTSMSLSHVVYHQNQTEVPNYKQLTIVDRDFISSTTLFHVLSANLISGLHTANSGLLQQLDNTNQIILTNLLTLDMSHSNGCDDKILRLIGHYCPYLSELNVQYCKEVTDDGLLSVIINRRLVTLNIRGTSLTGRTLVHLLLHCYGFKYFVVRCVNVTFEDLKEFILRCRTLRSFTCYTTMSNYKMLQQFAKTVNPFLKLHSF